MRVVRTVHRKSVGGGVGAVAPASGGAPGVGGRKGCAGGCAEACDDPSIEGFDGGGGGAPGSGSRTTGGGGSRISTPPSGRRTRTPASGREGSIGSAEILGGGDPSVLPLTPLSLVNALSPCPPPKLPEDAFAVFDSGSGRSVASRESAPGPPSEPGAPAPAVTGSVVRVSGLASVGARDPA